MHTQLDSMIDPSSDIQQTGISFKIKKIMNILLHFFSLFILLRINYYCRIGLQNLHTELFVLYQALGNRTRNTASASVFRRKWKRNFDF